VTVIPPSTTPTPDGGGGTGAGDVTETPTVAPEETPTPTETATTVPTATPTPPIAPSNVAVACETTYEDMPKRATVKCTGTIDGNYTIATFRINGVVAAADGLVMEAVFDFDTNLNVELKACNTTACATSTSAVAIEFPPASPTATSTPIPGDAPTPTATPGLPAMDVHVVCTALFNNGENQWHVGCDAFFNGQFTSILWSSVGATPPNAETTTKNWQFVVPGATLNVNVAATICNFGTCVDAPIVHVVPQP
jgi:hypothetical protein